MHKSIKILLSQAVCSQKLCDHSTKKCPDQLVGHLSYDMSNQKFSWDEIISTKNPEKAKNNPKISERKNISDILNPDADTGVIILVLESPHKDEYDDQKNPIGPANGKTGNHINKYLVSILNNAVGYLKPIYPKYDLILLNAIQYQCSLGVDPLIYRDAMFLCLWEQEKYKDDFNKRLKEIILKYNERYLLINGCTKGSHLDLLTKHRGGICSEYFTEIGYPLVNLPSLSLKALVSNQIGSLNYTYHCTPHPSSWYSQKNRKIY